VAELMRQKCPEERDKNQEDVNLPLEEERMVLIKKIYIEKTWDPFFNIYGRKEGRRMLLLF
jgi:hypothetical protein